MPGRPKRKAVSDTEAKAKKARGETDLGYDLKWKNVGVAPNLSGISPLIALTSETIAHVSKVAAFDIDFTVIRTASGRVFPQGPNDWMFWHDKVPEKLKALHEEGFRIVFFTNQSAMEKGKLSPQSFKDKVEAIIKELDIPVFVFISTGNNQYRKPSTKMWDYFVEECNKDVKVDKSSSFYVGDAAGRKKNWSEGKSKDFSCADRMFAHNIDLKFYTPEEFFLGETSVPFEWHSLDPTEFLTTNLPLKKSADKASFSTKSQEVVLMVGQPAAGKSTFCRRYFAPQGYTVVNRDTLGTMEKCIKVAREALKTGKSVVADNTNPSTSARANFIDLAKEIGVPCRCIWLKTPDILAHHLNLFRQNQTNGKIRRVPDVGFNVFKKNFEEPKKSEGFSAILELDFKPCFDSQADENLFKQWTA